MPKYISDEKREDIIFHKKAGKSSETIADFARVTVRAVDKIWALFVNGKDYSNKVHNCGRKSVISVEQEAKIIAKIKKTPDITLLELIEKFSLPITESGLSKYLIKRGYSFKKRLLFQQNKNAQMSKKNAQNSKKS
jgi:transposase